MENVDAKTLFILETAALTHDIGIHLCEENTETVTENYRKKKARPLPKSYWQSLVFPEKFPSGYSI